jgi:hypothetical protein
MDLKSGTGLSGSRYFERTQLMRSKRSSLSTYPYNCNHPLSIKQSCTCFAREGIAELCKVYFRTLLVEASAYGARSKSRAIDISSTPSVLQRATYLFGNFYRLTITSHQTIHCSRPSFRFLIYLHSSALCFPHRPQPTSVVAFEFIKSATIRP